MLIILAAEDVALNPYGLVCTYIVPYKKPTSDAKEDDSWLQPHLSPELLVPLSRL